MICTAAGRSASAAEQSRRCAVSGFMNRGRFAQGLAATAAAACAGSASAQSAPPTPVLSIEQISSPRLLGGFDLATATATSGPAVSLSSPTDRQFRLDPPPGTATGKRAKLSVAIGKSTLFAIAGKADRNRRRPPPELTAGTASRQSGGGKTYGAGIERRLGKFELGALYQYSKVAADQPETTTAPRLTGDKSHNVRATVRIRLRP